MIREPGETQAYEGAERTDPVWPPRLPFHEDGLRGLGLGAEVRYCRLKRVLTVVAIHDRFCVDWNLEKYTRSSTESWSLPILMTDLPRKSVWVVSWLAFTAGEMNAADNDPQRGGPTMSQYWLR